MPRGKKNGASPTIQEPDIEDEDEALQAALEFAVDTLTGDVRDAVLNRLRFEQSKRPWDQRSESDQRQAVHEIEAFARDIVKRAVEIIAGHGRKTIQATIDQVVFKDGIKAVIVASRVDPNRHLLADSVNSRVLIVVADPDEFTGERKEVEIKPDQAELLGEGAMAQHSAAEDNHDAPFAIN